MAMPPVPPAETPPTASVTIVLPVRNEERNIETCVRSLLNQTYREYSLVVVEGGSTDATPDILERLRAESPRLQVLPETPVPPGWIGKCWALETGAAQASGDWLLFTDADTEHHPGALAATVALAESHDVDLLSLMTTQRLVSFWERAVLPAIFSIIMDSGGSPRQVNDPRSPAAKANGQFLLIRRAAYEAVGGHVAIGGEIVHDYAMARLLKGRGYRILYADGRAWVSARMYRSLGEIWEGFGRMVFWAAQRSLARVVAGATWILGVSLGPYCLAGLSAARLLTDTGGLWSWLTLAFSGVGILWMMARGLAMAHGLRILIYGLLRPAGLLLSAAIMFAAAFNVLSRRGVTWKGRRFCGTAKTDDRGGAGSHPCASPKPGSSPLARIQGLHELPDYCFQVLRYVRWAEIPKLATSVLSGRPTRLQLKDGSRTYDTRLRFLDLLKNKEGRVEGEPELHAWEVEGRTVYATNDQIAGFHHEYFQRELHRVYPGDFQGKCVLDVGGFVGDSALYFLENGAQRVIIYEPVEENACAIRHNLQQYSGRFELFQQAVGRSDCGIQISSLFPPGTLGFGYGPGAFSRHVPCVSIATILRDRCFDIVKMDCEGCEICLLDVPLDLVTRVPYWMIETHSHDLLERIRHKFERGGFENQGLFPVLPGVAVCHFVQRHSAQA